MALSIRKNSDIKNVIIHHTQSSAVTGKTLNREAVASLEFGTSYDILINRNGSIDLSPRWIFASLPTQYEEDVDVRTVTSYSYHHYSSASEDSDLNKNAVHIAIVGNFDYGEPSTFQVNTLASVLNRLITFLDIDRVNVQYHSDVTTISCPGGFFMGREQLMSLVTAGKTIDTFSYQPTIVVDTGAPTLLSPANGTTDLQLNDNTFMWEAGVGASTYRLEISTVSSFSSTVVNQSGISDTEYTPSYTFDISTTYYWRVTSQVGGVDGSQSSTFNFTTSNLVLITLEPTEPYTAV